ncbi:hypothetical protein ACWAT4_27230 [Bradyrhizobium manausense]
MGRLPLLLYAVFVVHLGLVPALLFQGKSTCDITLTLLEATYFSIFISAVLLWRKGLPLNATFDEYRRRARFLRNGVYRVPTDDNAPSG